ncbi:MAG: D-alanine--D-alanine ligase [Eubacteriales bacterium]|nr:D-alanine--D-alanine ligase [Eubacteriales bacterium]
MNIVVLAGGLSVERDVSLTSGTLVCNALRRLGHRAILIDLFFGVDEIPEDLPGAFAVTGQLEPYKVGAVAPDIEMIRSQRSGSGYGEIGKHVLDLCRAADIVFMALHGDIGENGKLQAVFDVMDIKYTGTGCLGSALAMHKGVANQIFRQNGIKTPEGRVYSKADMKQIAGEFALPCIVKPCSGGSSIGIARATTASELQKAVEEAFRYEDEILVEEFISGRELTCGVLGDIVLPPAEIVPKGDFYDYTHKYQNGWITEICPARVPDEITNKIKEISLKAFRVLHLQIYARMDFIYDEKAGEIYCLEANTLPGLTPTSHMPQEAKAAGISYDELCEQIIFLSLKK